MLTKSLQSFVGIFILIGFTFCQNNKEKYLDRNETTETLGEISQSNVTKLFTLQDCKSIYPDLLMTIGEFVTKDFYMNNKLNKYESLKVDSLSSSILNVTYRFKTENNNENFSMSIGTIIYFEKTEKEAQESLELLNIVWGENLDDDQNETNNLDNILSFGETSKFIETRKNGELRGYVLKGRTKNIVFIHAIASNHINHHNNIELLKHRIKKLMAFANKYEK